MKKLSMVVVFAVCLGAAVPAKAFRGEPSYAPEVVPQSCARRLLAFGQRKVPKWISALVLAGVIGPPVIDQSIQHSLHHEVVALVSNDTHLGSGIYFNDRDWADVVASFTDSEWALLQSKNRDEMALMKLFTEKVSGDYDMKRIPKTEITEEDRRDGVVGYRYTNYPAGIRGSHFVLGVGQPRGNCEHKARVLAELLRRAGFDAVMERGMLHMGVAHAYVVVRLSDGTEWIADGTQMEVTSAARYRSRNVAYRIDYFGRPPPGTGN